MTTSLHDCTGFSHLVSSVTLNVPCSAMRTETGVEPWIWTWSALVIWFWSAGGLAWILEPLAGQPVELYFASVDMATSMELADGAHYDCCSEHSCGITARSHSITRALSDLCQYCLGLCDYFLQVLNGFVSQPADKLFRIGLERLVAWDSYPYVADLHTNYHAVSA